MSGPNAPPINQLLGHLGMAGAGGPRGPAPPKPLGQTAKRMGDDRVPMSRELPRQNPGQVQDAAARKFGVRPEQVQASSTPRPQAPPVQAPRTPMPSPERPQPPVQAPPPPTLPQASTPPPQGEVNPRQMSGIPMPQSRPEGAPSGSMLPAFIAKVLAGKAQQQAGSREPPSIFPYADKWMPGMGGGKPQAEPGASSAIAAPTLPPSDPFKSGAPPIQAGPQQLMQVVAAAVRAKAEQQALPKQPPTPPSPNVTPPAPPGRDLPPPPSMQERTLLPSQPSFQGYEVRKKPEKGEEKHGKALAKDNNPYYYSRIGVRPGDNAGVAQRLREVRKMSEDPKQAKKMTQEDDRILAQYNENDAFLLSMLPEDIARRMAEYKSGTAVGQMPDRYSERPPGVDEEAGRPTPLKLPPKSSGKRKKDEAVEKVEDAVQNPKKLNDTDPDVDDSGDSNVRSE